MSEFCEKIATLTHVFIFRQDVFVEELVVISLSVVAPSAVILFYATEN
jgi:hypothetical protein